MMSMRCAPVVVAVACLACVEEAPPELSRAALPIKSACTAASRAPETFGVFVHPGRRHSESQTIFVGNAGPEPRRVRVQQISRVEGPCSGDWARQTPLNYIDAQTRAAPSEVVIEPGQSVRLEIGDQRVRASWDCTKLGIAVWVRVDGEPACADAGAWISEGEALY